MTVRHSKKQLVKEASVLILKGTLRIGTHNYRSNWVVASRRYDVLLGMPWHVANNPKTDYRKRIVKVNENVLPLVSDEKRKTGEVKVMNIGFKKFRKFIKEKARNYYEVFQIVQSNTFKVNEKKKSKSEMIGNSHPGLRDLLQKYEGVFQEEFPDGLPPVRSVDHSIEVDKNEKPPQRPLFQLSPAELAAAKEYVLELLIKRENTS